MRPGVFVVASLMLTCFAAEALGSPAPGDTPPQSVLERRIDAMTDAEKIGQLLFVGFPGTDAAGELAPMLSIWNAGGVVIYRWNIESADQLRQLAADIRRRSKIPPFVAVDEEGGSVHRIGNAGPWLPTAMALGATRSTDLAQRAGHELGASLHSLGITMNFAPLLDIATNPHSMLTTRLLSDRAHLVSSLGRAFITGQASAGVIPVAKHFPGIGDAEGDSHFVVVSSPVDATTFRTRELAPWKDAIGAGLEAMMTGHVAYPAIDSSGTTATLSKVLLTEVLRNELKFDGVVITDEIAMRGIGAPGAGEAAVEAMRAGADMVMVVGGHRDRAMVFSSLLAAYKQGTLTEERLRQSLRRVLVLKEKQGILEAAPSPSQQPGLPGASAITGEIAVASVTLLANRRAILPLRKGRDEAQVAYIGGPGPLASRFRQGDAKVSAAKRSGKIPRGRNRAVIAVSNVKELASAAEFHELHPETRIVLVLLGSPSELRPSFDADAVIVTYGSGEAVQRAAGKLLFGEICGAGRMPVTVEGFAKYGDGLSLCHAPTPMVVLPR